jgi:hypothetical protein
MELGEIDSAILQTGDQKKNLIQGSPFVNYHQTGKNVHPRTRTKVRGEIGKLQKDSNSPDS